jgi:hypothetical protein
MLPFPARGLLPSSHGNSRHLALSKFQAKKTPFAGAAPDLLLELFGGGMWDPAGSRVVRGRARCTQVPPVISR